jgi:hypothetical protein
MRGFEPISYRQAVLRSLLHAIVLLFLHNLLNELVQTAKSGITKKISRLFPTHDPQIQTPTKCSITYYLYSLGTCRIENKASWNTEVNLRPTVSRPDCLGVRHPPGTRDEFFFLLEISFRQLRVYYFVAPSLTKGQVCNLLYNCFWALPEQSLLGRSPAELTAMFYCLI